MATLQDVPISRIVINPLNPRKDMGDLTEIRRSIVAQGLIQPLIVRMHATLDKYELVAGERRFTAISEAIVAGEMPADSLFPVIIRDMDDATTVQAMFIENMMRKDLTDYEQAASFKEFLDKYPDPAAIDELSAKTGININYIRRRAKVMALPKAILAQWENGPLLYGHLEQLLRVDAKQAEVLAKQVAELSMTIHSLKDTINKNKSCLDMAFFDKKDCLACQQSTSVQKDLFGEDYSSEKSMCMNPDCFYGKQKQFITENWKRLSEVQENKTNALIFIKGLPEQVITVPTVEACLLCEKYVTMCSETCEMVGDKACNGDKECFAKNYTPKVAAKAKKEVAKGKPGPEKTPEQKAEKKDENCGKEFAEAFYKKNLPAAMAKSDVTNLNHLKVFLIALVNSNKSNAGKDFPLDKVATMEESEVLDWLAKVSTATILTPIVSTLADRKTVANLFDLLLERDFLITKEYLEKKTKTQVIELSNKFGVIKAHTDKELQNFKKTAIIDMFMEKDLAGLIPDDILTVAKS